jgi:hypothetical protein
MKPRPLSHGCGGAHPDPPARSPRTGETTAELLDACRRLAGLLDKSKDIAFLSGMIQQEIIPRSAREWSHSVDDPISEPKGLLSPAMGFR